MESTVYTPTLMPTLTVDTRDANRCRQIISSLPITNVPTSHGTLHALLKGMRRVPPSAVEHLSLLELAREPLAFLQESLAARYANKPLPASIEETSVFERTVAVWRLMADSYAQVAQRGGDDPIIRQQLALICQRCIHYAGRTVIEYYRAHRSLAKNVWFELHGYFDTAEDWGLADQSVDEPLGTAATTTTSAATYATVLLVDLANPYGRTPRELAWIIRWAQMLAPETAVARPDEDAGGRGYGIDLMQDKGLLPVDHLAGTPSARLFDTSKLGERVQHLIARLKAGDRPASLGLGEDCPASQAARLLVQLYRPWCLAAMPRRFQRSRASGILPLAYGLESIYYQITGGDFIQPQHVRTYSRAEVERLWTFRNQMDPTQPLNMHSSELSATLDPWDIADQSLNGFRVFRNAAGPRVEHGQLVALKPPGKDEFLLALISWLVVENDGRLQAGIQVLPGPAKGVAVRPTGVGVSVSEQYTRGFFLPAVPTLKEPVSVIVPAGWYSPARVIEIHTDRSVPIRLDELLARGTGFERCSFALAT